MEERPTSVPEDAFWSPEENEWVLGDKNDDGELHGTVKYWRPDGTLCCECEFVDGSPHGPFQRFHENGELASSGELFQGALNGTHTYIRCAEPTSEDFPAGLGEEVWRAEMDFEYGNVMGGRTFDRQGQRCLEDGSPMPERPEGVPEAAHYYASEDLWVEGSKDDEQRRIGTWRWWTTEGLPVREMPFVEDEPHGEAIFYNDEGELDSKTTFVEGVPNGPAEEWFDAGFYANDGGSRVVERGVMTDGAPSGLWSWFDESGKRLGTVAYGVRRDEDDLMHSEAFANETRTAVEWRDVAKACKNEARIQEMLLAAARSASQSGNIERYARLLEDMSKPLSEGGAGYVWNQADGSLEGMLGALVGGAPPALCFRQMAVVLDQREWSFAAWDLINVAAGLDPENVDFHFTRSLVAMSIGDEPAARESAATLGEADPGRAEFLNGYMDILFPTFGWWINEAPSTYYDEVPEAPERDLDEIRSTIQKYATRLMQVRDQMLEAGLPEDAPYMLPDLSHVLPNGRVELAAEELVDEDGDAYDNDETLDMTGASVPNLMRAARTEWVTLNWLCWVAGLNEVALPDALEPPDDFGQAAGMASQRLWRCRDQEVTGGYMASQHGIPSFIWEGMAVENLPGPLLDHATFQYSEMQGLFYWLTDPDLASPWQDGLRGS